MSEQVKELIDMPKQFVKEGTQFINRCTKPDRRGMKSATQLDDRGGHSVDNDNIIHDYVRNG